MGKITVALLAGGVSSEREVSLHSGEHVYDSLDKDKYVIRRYDPQSDLARLVQDAAQIDIALIILHGAPGEDGTIQGMMDLLNIPYQGSGVLGSALAMNKVATRRLYAKAGLPVPPYAVFGRGQAVDVESCTAEYSLPLVVKPVAAGSSVGMSIVKTAADLQGAIDKAGQFDDAILVESYIDGMEITAGVIGNSRPEALPLVEIIPHKSHEFYDYEAKYSDSATQRICPARITGELNRKAQEYALIAHRALYCKGYSRTDMIIRDNEVYVLETNTIPAMIADSTYPQAAQQAGMNFSQLLDRLIELGLEAHQAGQQSRNH